MPLHVQTPLIESVPIGKIWNKRVFLKLECVQPVGSFKIRGVGALCEHYQKEGYKKLISPSSGNAGYATAWSARALGMKAVVVAPKTIPQEAIDAIELLDCEVIVHGDVWDEANELALSMGENEPDAVYVSSYEHPLIWAGHSTMVDEIAAQCDEKPDAIVLSVGGGGLICGVIEGLDNNGWGDIPVVGCGTYGANAFAETIKAGRLVRLDKVDTAATCISAAEVTQKVVDYSKNHRLIPYLTKDITALKACERFLDDHRLLVDLACGVALSAVYQQSELLAEAKNIVVIVCGGVGIKQKNFGPLREMISSRYK